MANPCNIKVPCLCDKPSGQDQDTHIAIELLICHSRDQNVGLNSKTRLNCQLLTCTCNASQPRTTVLLPLESWAWWLKSISKLHVNTVCMPIIHYTAMCIGKLHCVVYTSVLFHYACKMICYSLTRKNTLSFFRLLHHGTIQFAWPCIGQTLTLK